MIRGRKAGRSCLESISISFQFSWVSLFFFLFLFLSICFNQSCLSLSIASSPLRSHKIHLCCSEFHNYQLLFFASRFLFLVDLIAFYCYHSLSTFALTLFLISILNNIPIATITITISIVFLTIIRESQHHHDG